MAKKRQVLLISLLCASMALAQGTEDTPKPAIPWTTDYAEGMAQALAQTRPILIKFTAEWCGWCERMDVEVFVEASV
ncbi:MAG: thioredoxin family protein, partial [Planctomycetes bacterium]|nr:thioredoxin family protein [Planctomycetota bacterium]